jgi:hypothetical protein
VSNSHIQFFLKELFQTILPVYVSENRTHDLPDQGRDALPLSYNGW